ncbi:MAG: UvrD-helicase domain-containing protein, partial [Microbacteriaceae bacterium]|nr:UvrD-helicase domain-containing protein [Microbacteriaceae bacterium]
MSEPASAGKEFGRFRVTEQRYSAAGLAKALDLLPPTEQQARIIESELQPTLVVAGAGSGKTETMANRVVWLVANGIISPGEVLGLTF